MTNDAIRTATGLYLMLDELSQGSQPGLQSADLLGALSSALKAAVDRALLEPETPTVEPIEQPADPPADPALVP